MVTSLSSFSTVFVVDNIALAQRIHLETTKSYPATIVASVHRVSVSANLHLSPLPSTLACDSPALLFPFHCPGTPSRSCAVRQRQSWKAPRLCRCYYGTKGVSD